MPKDGDKTSDDADKVSVAYPPLKTQFEASDDWIVYNDRLEQFFLAYDITNEKRKAAVLLSSLAYDAFSTLSDLCFPAFPKDKSFKEICDLMENQFAPTISVFGERMKFYEAKQSSDETITEYVARLKSLTRYCKFEDYFENVLRDRFVCGLWKGPILSKVTELEDTASFQDCVKAALKKELSLKESGKLNQTKNIFKIDSQKSKTYQRQSPSTSGTSGTSKPKSTKGNCYACGEGNHIFTSCKYRTYKCKICKKVGHLAKVCRNNSTENNYMDTESENEGEMYGLYNLSDEESSERDHDTKCMISANIDGCDYNFEVDTGSRVSACSEKFYKKHLHMHSLISRQGDLKKRAYNGSRIDYLGEIQVKVTFKKKVYGLTLLVVRGGGNPLLGRDFLNKVNPRYAQEMFGSIEQDIKIEDKKVGNKNRVDSNVMQLVNKYETLFRDGIGCYKHSEVSFELKTVTVPVFHKARRVPLAFQGEYKRLKSWIVAL